MAMRIDPKSILIGALAVALVFIAMGAAGANPGAEQNKDESLKSRLSSVEQRLFQKLTAPMPGRFQMDATEEWAVIVDSATGQAWKHSLSSRFSAELCPPKLEPVGD